MDPNPHESYGSKNAMSNESLTIPLFREQDLMPTERAAIIGTLELDTTPTKLDPSDQMTESWSQEAESGILPETGTS